MSNSSCIRLEVERGDQVPQKWCTALAEEAFRRFLSQGGDQAVHQMFGEGSLFSPFLFGKFFDPSDAFPLWEFESESLLCSLRSSGKCSVDWFQTDQGYVLKAEVPGIGKSNVHIQVDKARIVEITGQLKKCNTWEWRNCSWWEYGFVRRLELPEDADRTKVEAYLINDMILEIRVPKYSGNVEHSDVGATKNSESSSKLA